MSLIEPSIQPNKQSSLSVEERALEEVSRFTQWEEQMLADGNVKVDNLGNT